MIFHLSGNCPMLFPSFLIASYFLSLLISRCCCSVISNEFSVTEDGYSEIWGFQTSVKCRQFVAFSSTTVPPFSFPCLVHLCWKIESITGASLGLSLKTRAKARVRPKHKNYWLGQAFIDACKPMLTFPAVIKLCNLQKVTTVYGHNKLHNVGNYLGSGTA